MSSSARRRFRSAADAVRFANRLTTMQQKHDRETAESAMASVPAFLADAEPAKPLSMYRRRILQEERASKLEAAGVFERRLGLKERSKNVLLSPKGRRTAPTDIEPLLSPPSYSRSLGASASASAPSATAASPIPTRRRISTRAPSFGRGSNPLRSPISRERKIAESDDESVDTASTVSDRPAAVPEWARRRSAAAITTDRPPRTTRTVRSASVAASASAKAQRALNAIRFANRLGSAARTTKGTAPPRLTVTERTDRPRSTPPATTGSTSASASAAPTVSIPRARSGSRSLDSSSRHAADLGKGLLSALGAGAGAKK